MTARFREGLQRFAYVPRALGLIWNASKNWTLVWFAALFIQGLIPAAIVYLTKLLVDSVVDVVNIGPTWEAAQIVLWPAILMGSALLVQQLLSSVIEYVSTAQAELVQDHISRVIHHQSLSVDFEYYESSEYYNRLNKASSEASSRSLGLLQNTGMLLQHTVTLIAISAILIPYGLWIPLVLILSTLPALYVVVKHNAKYHTWWENTTGERRQTRYLDMLLTYDFAAAEVRIFDIGSYLRDNYQKLRAKLRGERIDLIRKQTIAKLYAALMAVIATAGVMAWMVYRAMAGTATLGEVAMFYQAFSQGQGLMRSLLGSVGQIYTNTLFLEHLFEFLEIESKMGSPRHPKAYPVPIREGIRFRNVSFCYPGSRQYALRNFNLEVPAGRKIAIVGANGAGKTTVLKLLCRLYDPDEGTVTVDGIDYRDLRLEDVRRQVTVLFQFPMCYQATALDNIRMGDLHAPIKMARIEDAARGAMIHDTIQKLPKGYQTQLGKWFDDGTELSGGQWQRITLARAFYREASIVILDEPTSMMDSWAENEWLDRFTKLVRDQTAVIVTHRFTTAMRADLIYVMQDGDVIECGTHEELVAMNAHYAQSWRMQMEHRFSSDLVEEPSASPVTGSDRT